MDGNRIELVRGLFAAGVISAFISFLALLASVVALLKSMKAMGWTLRGLTGDVISKIGEIQSEIRELDDQIMRSADSKQVDNIRSRKNMLYGQALAKARHASYLHNPMASLESLFKIKHASQCILSVCIPDSQ